MAKADLTAERLRELLDYDPDTGVFTRRITIGRHDRYKAGEVAGCSSRGYIVIRVDEKLYRAQRLAWLHFYGAWPTESIDHIDCNKSNNAISNLRQASKSENGQNRRTVGTRSTSGLLGVAWHKAAGKWTASIRHNGKSVHLGLFADKSNAHLAYVEAKRMFHPFGTI